jgi:hypothetical protein
LGLIFFHHLDHAAHIDLASILFENKGVGAVVKRHLMHVPPTGLDPSE